MQIRVTKRQEGRHRLTVVRDDGSVSQGAVVPGFGRDAIPHDLLHALVERTLGLRRGVFGLVGSGIELAELLDPARKEANKAESELMLSEVVTTILQAESTRGGMREDDFDTRLRDQCAEHALAVPALSAGQLANMRELRDDYERRWRDLAPGDTLDVEVSA